MTETPAAACRRCHMPLPRGRLTACPRCLVEAELPAALLGDALELVDEIGQGGMGTVWKARQLRLGRTVAVKFLAARLGGDAELVLRFEREAQALARLNHPGIVAVHDFGRDEGRPYIVMEYVDGRPLTQLVPMPPAQARDVVLQVLDALEYAHGRGVIHRDIKPANVIVDAAGRAKVTDFGIARLLDAEASGPTLTATGRIVGTPAYMAPEAMAGAAPDARMDVFAVGVLLHEMTTGRRPAGRAVDVSAPLARVIDRAIAADPGARYPSAAAMRSDLAAADIAAIAPEGPLPAEERHWLRAVALVQTLATAAVLWALLLSMTPRVLAPADVQPLIMLLTRPLPDGRLVSYGRFETWPVLAAVGMVVVAVLAQGLLRRHWREAGLDRPAPARVIRESTMVFLCGAVGVSLYAMRRLVAPAGAVWTAYVPIVGGLLELAIVFLVWTAVLQAWRTSRPLSGELRLWVGVALALTPPVVDFATYLTSWTP
jgi:eukaryotic-like serine/threonine-protein kinase